MHMKNNKIIVKKQVNKVIKMRIKKKASIHNIYLNKSNQN